MKRYLVVLIKGLCLWMVLALFAGGCGKTLQFRDIQDSYNTAVETESKGNTVIGEAGQSNRGVPVNTYKDYYRDVIRQLDKDFISDLDEKLKPTAYVMLTVSHIRLGEFKKARTTAKTGRELNETAKSPRDRVYLQAVDGIILLESALTRYRGRDKKKLFTVEKYNESQDKQFRSYPEVFSDAYTTFSDVLKDPKNSDAPESIKAFVVFQKLRALTHWHVVFSSVKNKGDQKLELHEGVKQKLGLNFIPTAKEDKDKCLKGIFIHLSCENMEQAKTLDEGMAKAISYNEKGNKLKTIYDRKGAYEFCSDQCFK